MTDKSPQVSLVVATLGRTIELARLFESLLNQDFEDFEVIIVDQNKDERIGPILTPYRNSLRVQWIRTPDRRGVSAARNDGCRHARGEIVVFPDDDCWYPDWFLKKGISLLREKQAVLVSGRFADEHGRTINGRVSSRPCFMTVRSIWTTQSEAATFYSRSLVTQLGGFNEALGIGSASPWRAAEGPDLVLRALKRGHRCYFDPTLIGFHREYDLDDPNERMAIKARHYGRGMGHVLRQYQPNVVVLIYWLSRPVIGALISLIGGHSYRAKYHLSVSIGRLEGWLGHLWAFGMDEPKNGQIGGPAQTRTSFGVKRREMTGPYRARNPLLLVALYAGDAVGKLMPRRSGVIKGDRSLRILVANWGHLGDLVTVLPLIQFLDKHPAVDRLGILIGSWSKCVLDGTDLRAKVHVADHWALNRRSDKFFWKVTKYLSDRWRLVAELKRCRYDVSIDTFVSFPSTHGITWSAGVPRRIGFTSGGFGSTLTDPLSWHPDDNALLYHQLKLLAPLFGDGVPTTISAVYPGFEAPDIRKHLRAVSDQFIIFHVGPPDLKSWPLTKWNELAAHVKKRGLDIVLTGSSNGEVKIADLISEQSGAKNLAGQLSWNEFAAVIKVATAIVTVDSVSGHIAACFNVPAIVLTTGRERISLWRPNSARSVSLMHDVDCAPCHITQGCVEMACVRSIEVEDVLSELDKYLVGKGDANKKNRCKSA